VFEKWFRERESKTHRGENINDLSNNKLQKKKKKKKKSKSKSGRASGLTLDGVDGCPRVGEEKEECRFSLYVCAVLIACLDITRNNIARSLASRAPWTIVKHNATPHLFFFFFCPSLFLLIPRRRTRTYKQISSLPASFFFFFLSFLGYS
jgi:hypothetical protein